MSSATRYFLLTDTHRQQLTQRIGEALEAWAKAWGAGRADVDGIVIQSAQGFADPVADRTVTVSGEAVAWLAWPHEPGMLLDRLAGGAGRRAGLLAQQIEQRLLMDLLARIYGVDDKNLGIDGQGEEPPPSSLFRAGGDAFVVKIMLATLRLTLLMRGEAVRSFAPGPSPRVPAEAVQPLGKVIEGQLAHISVSLEVASGVLLDEISDLAEGHILLLDQALIADWLVSGPGGDRIGRCRPGRKGEHFAVQLLAPTR